MQIWALGRVQINLKRRQAGFYLMSSKEAKEELSEGSGVNHGVPDNKKKWIRFVRCALQWSKSPPAHIFYLWYFMAGHFDS
jgi:hypothetical protein